MGVLGIKFKIPVTMEGGNEEVRGESEPQITVICSVLIVFNTALVCKKRVKPGVPNSLAPTSQRPVRKWAAQQEVTIRPANETLSLFSTAPQG